MPTPSQAALRDSVRRRQERQYLTASDPNQNTRQMPSSIPGKTDPGFGYSIGDTSGSPSDIPTKYPYSVPIIDQTSAPSETPTKHTYPSRSCSHI